MLTKQEESIIIEDYRKTQSGHKTARNTGFTSRQVYGCLNRNKIPVTALNEINRKYTQDDSFFKNIDSHEKAHILGFVSADGCVYRKKGSRLFQVDLSVVDLDYLEYIKRCVKYTGPIRFPIRANRQYCVFSIYSSQIFNDLNRLGITERKSLTLQFPDAVQVPDEFIASFICGHFEGDGSIWFRKSDATPYAEINTVGTRNMVENIGRICSQKLGVTYTIKQNKGPRLRGINTWTIKISGNPQVMKVMEWMYANVPYKMMRKYSRYEKLLKHYDENGKFVPDEKWLTQKRERFIKSVKENNIDLGRALRKDYYLLSPEKVVYFVHGARDFAKEIGMSETSVIHVAAGKVSCKGWTTPSPDQIAAARANGTFVTKYYGNSPASTKPA